MNSLPDTAIAKVVKTFGSQGELVIRLYDVFPETIHPAEPVFVLIDGLPVPLFFRSFERRGQHRALVIFEDWDTEFRASELIGSELLAFEETEPDQELYYEDMAGFVLTDKPSGKSGIIREYLDYPNNPLFSVDFNGTEVMVPVQDDLLLEIDPDKKSVTASLPEGLLDLYLETSL